MSFDRRGPRGYGLVTIVTLTREDEMTTQTTIILEAQVRLDAERHARKLARVTTALRDLQAAEAVVRQLDKRLQEIARVDDDVFE